MVPYMWAAILIYALWPSMVNHLALFRDEFLKRLPKQARVLELACGHGVLSLLAAEERPDIHVEGLDISPPAVAVARRLLSVSGHGDRVSFAVKDALRCEAGDHSLKYEGILSAMLAEHLPDPPRLFQAIARQLAPEGLVFFSTAIESAQRDHVYEFNHESEPLRMAEASGLRCARLICDVGLRVPGGRFRPRALASILCPR